MSSWLDTETKALLEESPPEKLAPADTATFSLVLLAAYREDRERLVRAVERVVRKGRQDAEYRADRQRPTIVTSDLTHTEAVIGQFELVSCDAISVFLCDDVIAGSDGAYLSGLYASLLQSEEFRETTVHIESIPDNDAGDRFREQFLGDKGPAPPADLAVALKKARIMAHWGDKIGARVSIVAD